MSVRGKAYCGSGLWYKSTVSLGTLIDETVRIYVSGNLQEWPIAPRGLPCHVDDLRVSIQQTIEGLRVRIQVGVRVRVDEGSGSVAHLRGTGSAGAALLSNRMAPAVLVCPGIMIKPVSRCG